MEPDEPLSRRSDPLTLIARQDLDPYSVTELEARIGRLEAEIARVRAHLSRAADHRVDADALFKR